MATSDATTVEAYLAEQPADRREALSYVALAAQKNHPSLHLHGVDMDGARADALRSAFEADGKKLDMGKSCVRFETVDDLAVQAIRDAVTAVDPEAFIEMYESARRR